MLHEKIRHGINYCIILIDQANTQNINKSLYLFLREMKNVCYNIIHHNVNI